MSVGLKVKRYGSWLKGAEIIVVEKQVGLAERELSFGRKFYRYLVPKPTSDVGLGDSIWRTGAYSACGHHLFP